MAPPVEESLVLVTLSVLAVLARQADLRCSFLENRYFPFLKMQNELLAEERREDTEARLDLLPHSRYLSISPASTCHLWLPILLNAKSSHVSRLGENRHFT